MSNTIRFKIITDRLKLSRELIRQLPLPSRLPTVIVRKLITNYRYRFCNSEIFSIKIRHGITVTNFSVSEFILMTATVTDPDFNFYELDWK